MAVSGIYRTDSTGNTSNLEDLENAFYRVYAEQKPITTLSGRTSVSAVRHEWIIDTIAAAALTDIVEEGGNAPTASTEVPVRVNNYVSQFSKTASVADLQDSVKSAGNINSLAEQKAKKLIELGNSVELAYASNQASVAGASGVAPKLGGLVAWITTNVNAIGADGGFNAGTGVVDAASNGAQRVLLESYLRDVLLQAFNTGTSPNAIVAGGFQKQQIDDFTGRGQAQVDASKNTVFTSVDIYKNPYGGDLKIYPSAYTTNRDVLVLDTSSIKKAVLRAPFWKDLGTNNSYESSTVYHFTSIVVTNEAKNGAIRDLTTS